MTAGHARQEPVPQGGDASALVVTLPNQSRAFGRKSTWGESEEESG